MRVKLSYDLGAEISVAENIFFFAQGPSKKVFFCLCVKLSYIWKKSPPYNKEEFASVPRSKIF